MQRGSRVARLKVNRGWLCKRRRTNTWLVLKRAKPNMPNTDTVNLFSQRLINPFPEVRVRFLEAGSGFRDRTLFIAVNWLELELGPNAEILIYNNICIGEDIIHPL